MLNCVHLLAARYDSGGMIEIHNLPAQEFEELYPGLVRELSSGKTLLQFLVRVLLTLSAWSPRLRRKLMERILPVALHASLPLFGVGWVGVVNESSRWLRGHRLGSASLTAILRSVGTDACGPIALGGWGIRDWPLALRYRTKIAGLIKNRNPHHFQATSYLQGRRRPGVLLIGVLIRQTDYRIWERGRYFYETSEYVDVMRYLTTGRTVQFLVASDSKQDAEAFGGLDVIVASGREIGAGHYMESFFELSLCDKILSPPSSFALMAAYVGDAGVLLKMPSRLAWPSCKKPIELAVNECWQDADFAKIS